MQLLYWFLIIEYLLWTYDTLSFTIQGWRIVRYRWQHSMTVQWLLEIFWWTSRFHRRLRYNRLLSILIIHRCNRFIKCLILHWVMRLDCNYWSIPRIKSFNWIISNTVFNLFNELFCISSFFEIYICSILQSLNIFHQIVVWMFCGILDSFY